MHFADVWVRFFLRPAPAKARAARAGLGLESARVRARGPHIQPGVSACGHNGVRLYRLRVRIHPGMMQVRRPAIPINLFFCRSIMPNLQHCVIATRESPLAMWQALHVQALLRDRYPQAQVDILGMTTRGDQILDRTLSKVGGKGLFVKELEAAMIAGDAHLAVHSLKDVPMELPEGFVLAAVSEREDPRDAFVSPRYARLEDLPAGAKVGTASLRRELMLRNRFPHLKVESIRGNVGTRLSKLDAGQYDALVMAGAGLKRLGLSERIRCWLDSSVSLPSPGQGALGVEVRSDNSCLIEALQFINDPDTRACTMAERAVSRALGGSCQVPLAAYAIVENGQMWLRSHVGDHRTGQMIATEGRAPVADHLALADLVVGKLRAQGADALLAKVLAETA